MWGGVRGNTSVASSVPTLPRGALSHRTAAGWGLAPCRIQLGAPLPRPPRGWLQPRPFPRPSQRGAWAWALPAPPGSPPAASESLRGGEVSRGRITFVTCRGGSRRSWHPRAQGAAQADRRWGRGVERDEGAASGSRAEDRAGSWRKGMGERGDCFIRLLDRFSAPPEREGEKLERGQGSRGAFDCR